MATAFHIARSSQRLHACQDPRRDIINFEIAVNSKSFFNRVLIIFLPTLSYADP